MSNLIYGVTRTEIFEETYFCLYFIVSMLETNKNGHKNLLKFQKIDVRQEVIQIYYIIKHFLSYYEYATKITFFDTEHTKLIGLLKATGV